MWIWRAALMLVVLGAATQASAQTSYFVHAQHAGLTSVEVTRMRRMLGDVTGVEVAPAAFTAEEAAALATRLGRVFVRLEWYVEARPTGTMRHVHVTVAPSAEVPGVTRDEWVPRRSAPSVMLRVTTELLVSLFPRFHSRPWVAGSDHLAAPLPPSHGPPDATLVDPSRSNAD